MSSYVVSHLMGSSPEICRQHYAVLVVDPISVDLDVICFSTAELTLVCLVCSITMNKIKPNRDKNDSEINDQNIVGDVPILDLYLSKHLTIPYRIKDPVSNKLFEIKYFNYLVDSDR